jgi:hypothetical protein
MCNFHIYWEKNKRHYFLGSPSIQVPSVQPVHTVMLQAVLTFLYMQCVQVPSDYFIFYKYFKCLIILMFIYVTDISGLCTFNQLCVFHSTMQL